MILKILIADDSELLRRAVKDLLSANSGDWLVCGEADNGEDAVREVARLRPDVLLLDVSIRLLHGLTVAKIVKRDYPSVRVILMSEQDASVFSRLAEAAGTPYYVPKSCLAIDLIPLLRSLVKNFGKQSGPQAD